MASTDRKVQLFEDIVRLRAAERRAPALRELVTARGHLEHELGPSVSRSLAAHLLGVSHTALQRWIDDGDVPLVPTPRGSWQVPVAPLVELRESVTAARASGARRRHVLEPIMLERRARARALRPLALAPAAVSNGDPHERAQRRSLAYHAALAPRLRLADMHEALHQVWRWRDEERMDSRYADRWEHLLSRRLPEIRAALVDDSEHGRDLRQNSPFAGKLSEPERRAILAEIR